jgi:hypothetical protein
VTNKLEFWKAKADALAAATGVAFEGEPTTEDDPSGYTIMGASASNDIYDVRLDIAFPPPAQVGEEDGKPAEKAEGENAEEEQAPKPMVEWRELCFEKMQPGLAIPPRPQPPQR